MPLTNDTNLTQNNVWGRVPTQQSTVLAFSNEPGARAKQDVGLNGLSTEEEREFPTYRNYIQQLRTTVSPSVIARWEGDQFSPLNDPAGDNYHHYRLRRAATLDTRQIQVLQRRRRQLCRRLHHRRDLCHFGIVSTRCRGYKPR